MLLCFWPFSMMLLDGHQKNITQMTSNQPVARSKLVGRLQFKMMVRLHNLDLYGMRLRVITMMLLLGSTMMEIQVRMFSNCVMLKLSESESFCRHCKQNGVKADYV